MQGILNIRMLSVRAVLLAMMAAGLVLPAAQAQNAKQDQKSDKQASPSSKAQAPSTVSKAVEEESTPAKKEHASGPQEGIKIHGHWVIDVRSPDGKLVTHREFENAYVPNEFLASLLVRHQSQGFWLVGLSGISETYTMIEPEYTGYTGGVSSNNLSVFPDIHDTGFTLSGSFTAGPSDTISAVNTSAELCPNTVAPFSACQNSSTLAFTGTSISPGVSFFAGQIVQVTVTITFS